MFFKTKTDQTVFVCVSYFSLLCVHLLFLCRPQSSNSQGSKRKTIYLVNILAVFIPPAHEQQGHMNLY